jgi:hypothetical protein
MAHLKLVAGTAVANVRRPEYRVEDAGNLQKLSEVDRQAAARRVLRSSKLPGETRTVAELLAEVNRNVRDEHTPEDVRRFLHAELSIQLHRFGILLWQPSIYGWVLRQDFSAIVGNYHDRLIKACPELEPYADELWHLRI